MNRWRAWKLRKRSVFQGGIGFLAAVLATCLSGCGGGGGGGGGAIPVTGNTWSTQAFSTMPTARHSFAAEVVDGVIYAIGGKDSGGSAVGTVEAFDPAANGGQGAWTSKTAMPTARHALSATAVNGIIYAIGGQGGTQTVEAFDPAGNAGAGSWTSMTSMPTGRRSHAAAAVNGIIYVIGGTGGAQVVEAFDPTGNAGAGSWSSKTDMPTGRNELTAQAVNGIVYAIGGMSTCGGLATVEAFDPAGNAGAGAWSSSPDMPTARKGLTSVQVNGIVYAIGGIDSCDGGALLQTVEAFDPAGNAGAGAWSSKANMPTARQSLAGAVRQGVVFAIGGNAGTGTAVDLDAVEAYLP